MARARADFPNLDYGLWRLNNENILSPESELEVFQNEMMVRVLFDDRLFPQA